MEYVTSTIRAPPWVYAVIPVVNAVAFYAANVILIKMVFYPIEFIGWKVWQPEGLPFGFFGWQGIVPSQLKTKLEKVVSFTTEKLIRIEDTFARMDPQNIANRVQRGSKIIAQEALQDVIQTYFPRLWGTLPKYTKEELVSYTGCRSRMFILSMIQNFCQSIPSMLDMNELIGRQVSSRKRDIVMQLQKVGEPQHRLIILSGIWFGLLFGTVQATVFYLYGAPWVLLLSGLLAGSLSRLLAISFIYKPAEPYWIGCFQLQGLFAKQQSEAAGKIANLVEKELFKAEYIFDTVMKGKGKDRFIGLLDNVSQSYMEYVVAPIEKIAMPIFLGKDGEQNVQMAVARALKKHLPLILPDVYDNIDKEWGLARHLQEKLQSLTPTQFVSAMRLMHKGEETKLIIAGGIQGLVLGLVMYFIIYQWKT